MASEVNLQFSFVLSLLACQFFQKKLGRLPISHFFPESLGNNWPANLSESDTFLRIILLLLYFCVVIVTYLGSQKVVLLKICSII